MLFLLIDDLAKCTYTAHLLLYEFECSTGSYDVLCL